MLTWKHEPTSESFHSFIDSPKLRINRNLKRKTDRRLTFVFDRRSAVFGDERRP